jgi:hypothetical protein
MKQFLILCFWLIAISALGQKMVGSERASDHSIHVVGDSFEGVIFLEDYDRRDKRHSFTPSTDEILKVEALLPKLLYTVKDEGDYAAGTNSFIRNNLKSYYRQYWGYTNDKGEKVVFVNCLSKSFVTNEEKYYGKKKGLRWKTEEVMVFDGGKSFWRIKVNLTTQTQFDYAVNGDA